MTRTNAFSILCVVVRAIAMWLFATTIAGLPVLYADVTRLHPPVNLLEVTVAPTAFLLAVSMAMWLFADKIARLALARPQSQVFESEMAPAEWQAIALSVVGAWQAIEGCTFLVHRVVVLAAFAWMDSSGHAHPDTSPDTVAWLVSEAVRVAVGMVLLFGARGVVGAIRRFRGYGRIPVPDASDDAGARMPKPPD